MAEDPRHIIEPDGPTLPITEEYQPQQLSPVEELIAEKRDRLAELLQSSGMKIVTTPELNLTRIVDGAVSMATSIGATTTAHERLSEQVYALARKIEARNMAQADNPEAGCGNGYVGPEIDFLEELMGDIAMMALSQNIAVALAFGKPR